MCGASSPGESTLGAPIDDFSLHRRDDLWLERWDDTGADEVTDDVADLIDPIVEAVTKAGDRGHVNLTKADVVNALRARRVTFGDADVIPAVMVAAERGLIQADKPTYQRWVINTAGDAP